MITFETPGYLILLTVVPLWFVLLYALRSQGQILKFSYIPWNYRRDDLSLLWLDLLLLFERILFWLGFSLLIVALSGPARVETNERYANKGLDIMVVLDRSPSMSALDFGVENRLETAKSMIRPFVESRKNDAFGLVAFSSQAELLIPPTSDSPLFLSGLEALNIESKDEGTAIGMGLALGVLHLSSSTAEQKILLLLTDGENNAGEIQPSTAVSMAAQMNIRVYTIGIGSQGLTSFEFTDQESGKILSGNIQSRFDEDLLKNIAEQTGGEYYRAISSGSLNAIFKNIDNQESTNRLTRLRVERFPLHRWFILWGAGMILFSFILRNLLLQEVL